MTRQTRSDHDQITYRTYDDRAITRALIERTLQELDVRQRRHERWQHIRTYALTALVVLLLVAVSVGVIWWRLITPM